MDLSWQQMLVVFFIAAAGWSVTRKMVQAITAFRRGGGKCFGCQSECGTEEKPNVVQLSMPPRQIEQPRRG